MQSAKSIKFGRNGDVARGEASRESVDQLVAAKARELAGEIKLTRAQERLQKLRQENGDKAAVERHIIENEEWFVRRVNFECLNRIMMLTPRDARGGLILGAVGVLDALLTAMMFVCCVTGQSSNEAFFESWADAYEFVNDSGAMETCNALFAVCLKLNPEIWPEGEKTLRTLEVDGDSVAPLAFSTLPSRTLENGLTGTESTNSPDA